MAAAGGFRVGVLTISDRTAKGETEDKSGPACVELITQGLPGAQVVHTAVVPDDVQRIQEVLVAWSDVDKLDLILTTGGTGFTPRDQTPEATKGVLDREAPGFVIAMINAGLQATPMAILSRPAAGIRKETFILNLPGSPKAVKENLGAVMTALPHGLRLIRQPADPHS
eukprot:tig00000076_g2411.t1